jgi:hypothetical protein
MKISENMIPGEGNNSHNNKNLSLATESEWIKKMWYLYTMEFYSAIKKNEILSFAGKWMDLENITLSEVSQAQKTKNCMSPSYADCRSRANTTRGLDWDHMIRGEHRREI